MPEVDVIQTQCDLLRSFQTMSQQRVQAEATALRQQKQAKASADQQRAQAETAANQQRAQTEDTAKQQYAQTEAAANQQRAQTEAAAKQRYAQTKATAGQTRAEAEAMVLAQKKDAHKKVDEQLQVARDAQDAAYKLLRTVSIPIPQNSAPPVVIDADPEQALLETLSKISLLERQLQASVIALQTKRSQKVLFQRIALVCSLIALVVVIFVAFSAYKNSLYDQAQAAIAAHELDVAAAKVGKLQFLHVGRSTDLLIELVRAAIATREWDVAVEAVKRARTLDATGRLDLLVELAQAAIMAREWDVTVEAAELAQVLDAVEGLDLLVELAQAAITAHEWDVAVEAVKQAQALGVIEGLDLSVELAQAAIAAHEWDVAVEAARLSQSVDVDRGTTLLIEVYSQKAQTAIARQDWTEAKAAAEHLYLIDSERGKAILELLTLQALEAGLPRLSDGMIMVYVPKGRFQMGSEDPNIDAKPVHTVVLDAFWLDQMEVTNAQYEKCVALGGCAASWLADRDDFNSPQQPVVGIAWHEAELYCAWAMGRLPTEAEWEYAARGPGGSMYPWGNQSPTCDLANYWGCAGKTMPVGSYPEGASWIGALDLVGNVSEWVVDWYRAYGPSQQTNPVVQTKTIYRVVRGSAWNSKDNLYTTKRFSFAPIDSSNSIGFRCALSASSEE